MISWLKKELKHGTSKNMVFLGPSMDSGWNDQQTLYFQWQKFHTQLLASEPCICHAAPWQKIVNFHLASSGRSKTSIHVMEPLLRSPHRAPEVSHRWVVKICFTTSQSQARTSPNSTNQTTPGICMLNPKCPTMNDDLRHLWIKYNQISLKSSYKSGKSRSK